ncbi:uncharacterized protein LOC126746760 isoform X2 [Anthonomus grandis grandis]|uniref:uncharacterized protein LOC126746760 isoform X2 n=1 Tax=Anthonomus grandis grandis TaxID=2921223 RepID=UPI00216635C9|nr:uncharacterized protein LOC126746760 isoform X2 [Anthonomus grandis grandis]
MGVIATSFFWIALVAQLSQIYAKDTCANQVLTGPTDDDPNIHSKPLNSKECQKITFRGSDKLNTNLGSLRLKAFINTDNTYSLSISFADIKWKRAYLWLSQDPNEDSSICRSYSIDNPGQSNSFTTCFNLESSNTTESNYILDFWAELNADSFYKTLVFRLPAIETFGNQLSLPQRSIFSSIDSTSNYEIVQKIQTLPSTYNVTYYKVEVFKEKDNKEILLDVRMLKPQDGDELAFEYITYNEEGYYYFKVSAISESCGEDQCLKSITPRIYIKRKYPPLVIGIVGASFLIPCVLFVLHLRSRHKQKEVYSQTPEKHYAIVKTLEKALKTLGEVQISPKVTEASHILYICGTHIFEPDPITHKYLVIEANKAISKVEILIIQFPYSTKEIPPYLRRCLRFNLMEDFSKFIHLFNCEAQLENNLQYEELKGKVQEAQLRNEPKKIILNMPIIIVTEQSDSDSEAREADGLLKSFLCFLLGTQHRNLRGNGPI